MNKKKFDWFPYLLVSPAILFLLIVVFYPFFYNILISLSNMNMLNFHHWKIIGLKQYGKVLFDPVFYSVFLKTIIWTVANVSLHVIIGVFLAILLNRALPGRNIFRMLLILPWAVPQYITALTWRGMFNYQYGAVNGIITKVLHLSPIQWLSNPTLTFTACLITNVWLGFPFMMVIALGALQTIPKQLYEVADIEGASSWQKTWRITIPMIKPVMIPAITLGTLWTFNNLNVIWLVSNGGEPSNKTHILVSYVYKAAFHLYRYGYAAAFSMIIFLILLVFTVGVIKKTKTLEVTR